MRSPRPHSPFVLSSSPQRSRILAAAARLFQRQGYPATSVRMLAAEVQLGASSLYNHIDGKQELLREICDSSAQRFADGLDEVEASAKAGPEFLAGLIGLHVRLALEHPETVTVFNDEWRHLEPAALDGFLRKRKAYERRITDRLQREVTAGTLRDVPLAVAVPTLLSSLSWVYNMHHPTAPDARELAQQLTALWATGWQSRDR